MTLWMPLQKNWGGGITNSDKFDDSYWEIVFESNKNTHRYGANYENLGEDW